jgi:hypothetical protein
MKRKRKVHRSTVERSDGQHRWDCAYQCVLRWASEEVGESGANPPFSSSQEENQDASRRVRSCLDAATATITDH